MAGDPTPATINPISTYEEPETMIVGPEFSDDSVSQLMLVLLLGNLWRSSG